VAAGIHYALDIIAGLLIAYFSALIVSKAVTYLRAKKTRLQ
jgi:membrane-associated phospholipid phosphatase